MKKAKLTILLATVLFVLLCHFQGASTAIAGSNDIASVLTQAPAADIGKKTTCAYCGMHLTVNAKTPAASYEGKNYYFCDEMERDAFIKEPNKYLSAAGAASPPMAHRSSP